MPLGSYRTPVAGLDTRLAPRPLPGQPHLVLLVAKDAEQQVASRSAFPRASVPAEVPSSWLVHYREQPRLNIASVPT